MTNLHDALTQPPAANVLCRCAVPTPMLKLLDYTVPEGMSHAVRPGVRVQVPLGKRLLTAVVVTLTSEPDVATAKLRAIERVLDDSPLLNATLLALLQWTARYYLHPAGEVFTLGLSPRERRGEPPAPTGEPGVKLNARGLGLPEGALKRAKQQAHLLYLLQQRPHSLNELAKAGISRAIVRALSAKDLTESCDIRAQAPWASRPPLPATAEQRAAVDAIVGAARGFSCHLLEGVTGSGKTEVYLQCAAAFVANGQQVLVLLPEIGLTPQMISRFEARFDAPVVPLHSGLSESERDRGWAMARDGSAAIILGTRSAVFVPLRRPGLIIVDEEHDQSFNQQDGLRYSARDVAVKRAQLSECPVILGSATPSLESFSNVQAGRYQLHRLTERAAGAQLPRKTICDIRALTLDAGLSPQLIQAIDGRLRKGQQVLLFLNRRGFAPTLLCHDCGWFAGCHQCDARLALHRNPAELRCHHCNARERLPRQCPSCHGARLVSAGLGTEQTELALTRLFPDRRIYRVDSDTMTGRHAMRDFTQQLEGGEPCIILGTQMLTKGHHFPAVTLVGVVDADGLLFSPDFRGEERLLQLLTQVGGRAGRGEDPGEVMIQTHFPEHALITAVMDQDYNALASNLLVERQQRGLPPAGSMALVRCDSKVFSDGLTFLNTVRTQLGTPIDVQVIGPIPAAMSRRAGRYRAQLLLVSSNRRTLHHTASRAAQIADAVKRPGDLKWFMDIDPAETV